ncbi:MAG: purine-nucleoside phosphorylase [Bacteroidetes bacterium]|nr:purine-nucleoside phosphorylase [Bacteroidota bacterium]
MKERKQLPFAASADYINRYFSGVQHDIAIVLGSGLGGFTAHLSDKKILKTVDVTLYPQSTVAGHSGEIVSARLADKRVLVFSGRVHYYESASTVNSAVTAIVSNQLGIENMVLTNAAGILNESFDPGDLMLIRDQINLTFRNVVVDLGSSPEKSQRIYSEQLVSKVYAAAEKAGVNLKAGVYLGLTGPSYETAAEVKAYRILGGDAVGMSTVQEAIFAQSVGMQVVGISCLTNYCTGITSQKLSHEEVTEIGAKVDEKFSRLLSGLIELL